MGKTFLEKKKEPLVSICIVSYNRKKDLAFCLKRILKNEYKRIEVIVFDNASNDGTALKIPKNYSGIKFIRGRKNIGIYGWNIAAKKAKGKYILFLDDDSFPQVNAVSLGVSYLMRHKDVSAVAMNIKQINETGKFVSVFRVNRTVECGFFIGAGVMMRAKIFRDLGGFSKHYFLYGNEWDLSLRIYGVGGKIIFLPKAIVFHLYSPTNRTSARRVFYGTRNSIWTVFKNYPIALIPPFLFLALGREFLFAIRNQNVKAYFGGVLDSLRGLSRLYGERRPLSYRRLFLFYRALNNFSRANKLVLR